MRMMPAVAGLRAPAADARDDCRPGLLVDSCRPGLLV